MLVSDLKRVLQATSKAAAPSADIPALGSTFFTGVEALAFNDTLCIMEPCSLPIRGGFDSKLLNAWSKGLPGKEFKYSELPSGSCKFSSGRSRISLTQLRNSEFPFTDPVDQPDVIHDCEELHKCLIDCSLYLGFDQDELWRSGVSISCQGSVVALYATNNLAVVRRVITGLEFPVDGPRIVPAPMVDYLTKVDVGEIDHFEFGAGWVRAVFRRGGWVWCASPADADPDKIDDVLVQAFDGAELLPVSQDLVDSIQDVVSIARVAGEDKISLSFVADRVTVSVESLAASHSVAVLFDNDFNTKVDTTGSVLLTMLRGCDHLGVTESAVVASSKHFNGAVALLDTAD